MNGQILLVQREDPLHAGQPLAGHGHGKRDHPVERLLHPGTDFGGKRRIDRPGNHPAQGLLRILPHPYHHFLLPGGRQIHPPAEKGRMAGIGRDALLKSPEPIVKPV